MGESSYTLNDPYSYSLIIALKKLDLAQVVFLSSSFELFYFQRTKYSKDVDVI